MMFGTNEGTTKGRDIKRKSDPAERWNPNRLAEIAGTPWEPIPGRGEIEVQSRVYNPRKSDDVILVPNEGPPKSVIKKRFKILPTDMGQYGFTERCQ